MYFINHYITTIYKILVGSLYTEGCEANLTEFLEIHIY